jgi:hypothetical protein
MPEFAGFNDWIEIFRGGRQVDSNGREHDGDALIERAVSQFNAAAHEPPLVVGHPRDNSPAFGWVEGLKTAVRDGAKVMLAKCKQVVPEFEAAVRQGVYKKRSAAFYPDGRLRHVGFLGGMPPAVKALADIGFAGAAESVFEFNENQQRDRKEAKMKFSEFMEIFKFWKQVEQDPDLELPKPAVKPADAGKTFSESELAAQVEAAKKQAEADARKAVEAEFAEKSRKAEDESRRSALKAWYDAQLAAGKIAPAWGKLGLLEFMQGLDAGAEVQFAEGTKCSPAEFMKKFVSELPKVIEFKEIASRDKDVSGDAGGKLDALVKARREKEPTLTFSEALTAVQLENPELAREYAAGIR